MIGNFLFYLKSILRGKGREVFVVYGLDFVVIIETIQKICRWRNFRFIASIAKGSTADIQLIHPLVFLDSNAP